MNTPSNPSTQPESGNRRHFTPEQKVAVLRQHLLERVPLSEVCNQHRIAPTLFYQWQKAFFENGAAAFASTRAQTREHEAAQAKITALEARLRHKDEVIAEVVEELVHAKKELGES
jgi:transposase-like protein